FEDHELRRQLTEALEQRAALSEILRVISQSPADIQPVFDTIVRNAVRLCGGLWGTVFRFDGELIHLVAWHNFAPEGLQALQQMLPMPPDRRLGAARAILTRAIVHIEDVFTDPEYAQHVAQASGGFRRLVAVPMLGEAAVMGGREGVGGMVGKRGHAGPFSEAHIELLKTFADQAVIAVENVRLFRELQTSNRQLTTALRAQTAIGEILRVINRSQMD